MAKKQRGVLDGGMSATTHEVALAARAWLARRQADGQHTCAAPQESLLPRAAPPAATATATATATRPRELAPSAADPAAARTAFLPPVAALSPSGEDSRQAAGQALDDLRRRLLGCRACKLSRGRTNVVVGCGQVGAQLMWVGEGPGRDEDLQGEPFVGEAGRLLDRMLQAMGVTRQEVYIANIVKCRPPRNRDPEPDEIAACVPFVRQQVELVGPRVIVALGRFAAQTLLGSNQAIGRLRGHWQPYPGGLQAVMPTFHPAYLLRNPAAKKLVWQDLQAVIKALSGAAPIGYNAGPKPPSSPLTVPAPLGQ